MISDFFVKSFTKIAYIKVRRVEKQAGYALVLHDLSPHWIDAVMTYDMTPVWQRENLDAYGVNYFTIGAIKNGLSARYDFRSPYYQAWFGGYIVKFSTPKEWTVRKHYELGVADQKNWLRIFGDRDPFVTVDEKRTKEVGRIAINGYTGKLYEGGIWSDTDVGEKNKQIPLLSKKWDPASSLASYQKIYLYGYIAIIEITPAMKAVLYANGATYTDTKGKKYNTFEKIRSELLHLLQNVEIKKV